MTSGKEIWSAMKKAVNSTLKVRRRGNIYLKATLHVLLRDFAELFCLPLLLFSTAPRKSVGVDGVRRDETYRNFDERNKVIWRVISSIERQYHS